MKRRHTAVLGVAVLTFIALTGLSYREWRLYIQANSAAAQARAIVGSVARLQESLVDAEAAERGFLLTGDEKYLYHWNESIRQIPGELSAISRLLGSQPGQSSRVAQLTALTSERLADLRADIALRHARGVAPSISDAGRQTMEQIRAICAGIQRAEIPDEPEVSAEREAAASTALLATIAGSMVLLFLFAFSFQPFASPDPAAWQRPPFVRYGAAVLAVVAIALIRAALVPLIGRTNLPFTLFFCAVAFAAWFGGFGAALLSIVLSVLVSSYFFAAPTGTLLISGRDDQVAVLMLVVVGFGIGLLSRAQRGAVGRALRAESAERNERQRYETTLASIGDAVITTDANGRITFLNAGAESITGWSNIESIGKPLDQVFVVYTETGVPVEDPVSRALSESGTDNGTREARLIRRDGRHIPIGNSAAPIRERGTAVGVVLVFRDISERKNAEQMLRAERELLQVVVGHMSAAICLIRGEDLRIELVNPAYQAIAPGKQMTGKTLDEVWPEGGEDLATLCRRVLDTGEPHQVTDSSYRIRRTPDGSLEEAWFNWSLHRVRLPGDGGWGILNSAWETTSRIKAELARRESEATLRAVYDNSPLLTGVTEIRGDDIFHVYDNYATCRFFGAEPGSTSGKLARAELGADPAAVGVWIEHYRASEATGHPVAFEHLHSGPVEDRWLSVTLSPIGASRDGRTRFCYVAEDVTERKEAEEALRTSEERFRMLADNMSQLAWIADAAGVVQWYNQRWYEYTGTTFNEMRRSGWHSVHHPDHLNRVLENERRSIGQGVPWEETFPLRGGDGGYRWFLTRAVPIRGQSGSIVRWFGTNTDITEQLETERQLRRANAELEQFAYSASHDLQEPLRNIAVFAQMLQRRYAGKLDEEADLFIRQMTQGAQRMGELIGDLLAYTRAGSEQEAARMIQSESLLAPALEGLKQLIAETDAIVTHDPLPAVHARGPHLQQLFQNLIGNALKYRNESEPPRIHVAARRRAADYEFSITDNGIGIEPEYHERIFGVFKRLHTDPKYDGTGIGLAICKKIVEQYGGKIWVSSQPGAGSTFYFTLPYTDAAENNVPSSTEFARES
ncbi:MAG TPA: PAS domain S-box protein [Bryobacteraceae bacterium]|nr:PAS domain S-box protein [Bryobacteraceae bacterium]